MTSGFPSRQMTSLEFNYLSKKMIIVVKNQQTSVLLLLLQLPGLTKETALALRQTSQAITGLSDMCSWGKCSRTIFKVVLVTFANSLGEIITFLSVNYTRMNENYALFRYSNNQKFQLLKLLKPQKPNAV